MDFGPQPFHWGTRKPNFGTLRSSRRSRSRTWKDFACMKSSGYEVFIKFQQLATHVQWGEAALCRQAYNGLANVSKTHVHHEKPKHAFRPPETRQAIDAWYWEQHGEVSRKTFASGTSGNKTEQKSDSSKSDNKSAKVLRIPSRRTTTRALPRARVPLPNKETHHSWPFLKTRKSWKLTPQERQRRLTTSFASFVAPLDTSPRIAEIYLGLLQG